MLKYMYISYPQWFRPEKAIPIGRPFFAKDTVFSYGLRSMVTVILSPALAGEA